MNLEELSKQALKDLIELAECKASQLIDKARDEFVVKFGKDTLATIEQHHQSVWSVDGSTVSVSFHIHGKKATMTRLLGDWYVDSSSRYPHQICSGRVDFLVALGRLAD